MYRPIVNSHSYNIVVVACMTESMARMQLAMNVTGQSKGRMRLGRKFTARARNLLRTYRYLSQPVLL